MFMPLPGLQREEYPRDYHLPESDTNHLPESVTSWLKTSVCFESRSGDENGQWGDLSLSHILLAVTSVVSLHISATFRTSKRTLEHILDFQLNHSGESGKELEVCD